MFLRKWLGIYQIKVAPPGWYSRTAVLSMVVEGWLVPIWIMSSWWCAGRSKGRCKFACSFFLFLWNSYRQLLTIKFFVRRVYWSKFPRTVLRYIKMYIFYLHFYVTGEILCCWAHGSVEFYQLFNWSLEIMHIIWKKLEISDIRIWLDHFFSC